MWSKRGQIWGIQKERPCKALEFQQLTRSFCASGGTHGSVAEYGKIRQNTVCYYYNKCLINNILIKFLPIIEFVILLHSFYFAGKDVVQMLSKCCPNRKKYLHLLPDIIWVLYDDKI